jgi:hypothetical protein
MTQTGYTLKTLNQAQKSRLAWLNRHVENGFQPKWFLTVHFHYPTDSMSRTDINANRCTDLDSAYEYARLASNALQRVFWSNREGSRRWRHENPIPTLFAVERDLQQHHLHIMIPPPLNFPNTQEAIKSTWGQKMIPACKSLSNTPIGFDVRPIWDLEGLFAYFVKQTTDQFPAIDDVASTLPPLSRISNHEFHTKKLSHSLAQLPQPLAWPLPTVQHFKAGRNWSSASY